MGEPCVACALYDIFTALSTASKDIRREAVAPTSLRIALSNLYPDSNFFQEAFLLNFLHISSFCFIVILSFAHNLRIHINRLR